MLESNQREIEQIEQNISELAYTVQTAIEKEYAKMSIPSNTPIPIEILKDLKLDRVTLDREIIGKTKNYINEELKGWFMGYGRVKVKAEHEEKIIKYIETVIYEFTQQFLLKRKKLLERQRDVFMKAIKDIIVENGNIRKLPRDFLIHIPAPSVSVGNIYYSNIKIYKVLLFKIGYLDKQGLIEDIETSLVKITRQMLDDYSKDYRESLETVLIQIKSEFEQNLDKYSLYMQSLIESREGIMRLDRKVSDAVKVLAECHSKLNEIIWKEI